MPREKKDFETLHPVDYDIAGNAFRAWKNDADELIFVLDETIDDFKPNVLLVLAGRDDRKWDDILANDYGINLEDVRPKVDNKYQKLDIEYTGLDVYAQLIDDYERGADLDAIIADLIDFRDTAARRSAMARLAVANDIIAAAEDTILRTERTKNGLRERRQNLRARLAKQREYIGREPTKQSAARILRTEAQIDTIAEKLARAEKRIENAKHRIEIATEDANAARDLLARRRTVLPGRTDAATEQVEPVVLPARKKSAVAKTRAIEDTEIADAEPAILIDTNNNKSTEPDDKDDEPVFFPVPDYEYQSQPRDEEMADQEEVKPLLDQDPEILDEEIAFKPVEFDDIKPRVDDVPAKREYAEPESMSGDKTGTVARPLAFSGADVEDVDTDDVSPDDTNVEDAEPVSPDEAPVLDTIKTVAEPNVADTDTTGHTTNTQYDNAEPVRPAAPTRATPVTPGYTRPISPITGNAPVRPVGENRGRSGFAYYLLLILLIVLSVFTLWLYQKKNGNSVPFLNAPTDGMIEQPAKDPTNDVQVGFDEPQPIIEPVMVEPEPIVEPEPDIPVVIENEPIKIEYPNNNVLRAAEPDVPVVEAEEDVLARKDAYDVAREDKPIYVPMPEPRVTNVVAPDVIFDDDIISVPAEPANYVDEGVYVDDEAVYYPDQYYDANAEYYDEYGDNAGGFVEEPREPKTTRHLDVYDGGQYSIGYTETTY